MSHVFAINLLMKGVGWLFTNHQYVSPCVPSFYYIHLPTWGSLGTLVIHDDTQQETLPRWLKMTKDRWLWRLRPWLNPAIARGRSSGSPTHCTCNVWCRLSIIHMTWCMVSRVVAQDLNHEKQQTGLWNRRIGKSSWSSRWKKVSVSRPLLRCTKAWSIAVL